MSSILDTQIREITSLRCVVAAFCVAVLGGCDGQFPAAVFAEESGQRAEIYAFNKQLGRGMNLGNALEAPREGAWGVTLEADYFKEIRAAGFDTVRLPVRWSAHASKETPFAIDADFFERVDWAVDRALENELNVIVNVHHYDELYADPDNHVSRLAGLWEQIAARYQDRPTQVVFELLNEPHDRLDEAKWNAALPPLLAAIRNTNPERAVIIGPGRWNNISALGGLELLEDDRRLIVTVHYYEPFMFTHQGASWAKGSNAWLGKTWSQASSHGRRSDSE